MHGTVVLDRDEFNVTAVVLNRGPDAIEDRTDFGFQIGRGRHGRLDPVKGVGRVAVQGGMIKSDCMEIQARATRSGRAALKGCGLAWTGGMGTQLIGLALWGLVGCSQGAIDKPATVLANAQQPIERHRAALGILEATEDHDTTVRMLKHMLGSDQYRVPSKALAYKRLRVIDPDGLSRFLEIRLPRAVRVDWRQWLCEAIAEDGWLELTSTLIRAWARPVAGWSMPPAQRPERLALVQMYGEENLDQVLLRVMLDANPITAANLRARCWELLVEEGSHETLVALLESTEVSPRDGMLRDLKRIAASTGILPRNREEILWARALCTPERGAYLEDLEVAIAALRDGLRGTIEFRDLSVIQAAHAHAPELLQLDDEALYNGLQERVRSEDRRIPSARFEGWRGRYTEALHEVRDQLDWADLIAMRLALSALDRPEVMTHLFDQADRDLADKKTEYGGVIGLDEQGRYHVVEFAPRSRQGDNQFVASQDLFDRGYSALFHFHNHAQKYDNREFAGPHLGDLSYADNTRANCLVFTFLSSRELDVDFYRHGKVVVDLGVIRR